MGDDWLLRLGYVGTKTTHLMADYDQNAPLYDFSRTLNQNQANIDQRRPRQEYQHDGEPVHGLNQSYNSLQISINKRFSRGFSVLTSYTFSKNIDYSSHNNNMDDNVVLNPFNFGSEPGPADNDHPHRLVTSYVWELPGKSLGRRLYAQSWATGNGRDRDAAIGQAVHDLSSARPRGGLNGRRSPSADLVGTLRSRGAAAAKDRPAISMSPRSLKPRPAPYGTLGRNLLRGPNYKIPI